MRPKRCAFRGLPWRNKWDFSFSNWAYCKLAWCCPQHRVFVILTKKESRAVSKCWVAFQKPGVGRKTAALWLGPPKGQDQVENGVFSSLIKKLFLKQFVYSYQRTALWAARDSPQNPQKEFYLIKQWIWIFFLSLSIFSSYGLNLITCQPRPLESHCSCRKQKFSSLCPGSSARLHWPSPSVGSMVTAYTLLWALEWFWCNIVFIYF